MPQSTSAFCCSVCEQKNLALDKSQALRSWPRRHRSSNTFCIRRIGPALLYRVILHLSAATRSLTPGRPPANRDEHVRLSPADRGCIESSARPRLPSVVEGVALQLLPRAFTACKTLASTARPLCRHAPPAAHGSRQPPREVAHTVIGKGQPLRHRCGRWRRPPARRTGTLPPRTTRPASTATSS